MQEINFLRQTYMANEAIAGHTCKGGCLPLGTESPERTVLAAMLATETAWQPCVKDRGAML